MARHLVVAHQTAESDELREHLSEISAADHEAEFVLLVPATPVHQLLVWEEGRSHDAARRRAVAARAHLERSGIRVVEARVGDGDAFLAVEDELLSEEDYASIVIATLPVGVSRWLHLDLPARVRRLAPGTTVAHVVCRASAMAHT